VQVQQKQIQESQVKKARPKKPDQKSHIKKARQRKLDDKESQITKDTYRQQESKMPAMLKTYTRKTARG